MNNRLCLIDSFTNEKYYFIDNNIKIYCCGITAQSQIHAGHCRTFIIFDSVRRLLSLLGHKVDFGTNITDVDHKINKKINDIISNTNTNINNSNKLYDTYKKFTNEQTNNFINDCKKLNMLPIEKIFRVSEIIPQIVNFINKLIENKYAYEKNGNVYFSIDEYNKNFNCTSNQPNDFLLWIAGKYNDITFDSPWNSEFKGYPAWHITCSVINSIMFDDFVHLHGGGEDLKNSHHLCECLQTNSYFNKKIVFKNFMHVAVVTNNGIKLTKSLNNCLQLEEMLINYTPNEIRIMCLLKNYHKQIEIKRIIKLLNKCKTYFIMY